MDEKEKKKQKIKCIGWIIFCVFAIIFGIVIERYGVIIAFTIVAIFKYFEMKYPELLG